jgi:hypothetical protein
MQLKVKDEVGKLAIWRAFSSINSSKCPSVNGFHDFHNFVMCNFCRQAATKTTEIPQKPAKVGSLTAACRKQPQHLVIRKANAAH